MFGLFALSSSNSLDENLLEADHAHVRGTNVFKTSNRTHVLAAVGHAEQPRCGVLQVPRLSQPTRRKANGIIQDSLKAGDNMSIYTS